MEQTETTSERLRAIIPDLQKMASHYDEKMATKEDMIARLTYIFNDDRDLALTVYDYVARGHLSYANQLRNRFAQ